MKEYTYIQGNTHYVTIKIGEADETILLSASEDLVNQINKMTVDGWEVVGSPYWDASHLNVLLVREKPNAKG